MGEYECKIKNRKKVIDYNKYRFYDRRKSVRALKFLHRVVSNIFLRAYLKIFHGVRVVGKANALAVKTRGVVVVSNHIHPLDLQMIMTFVFGMRDVHFLTLKKNFDLRVSFFVRNSGGVPIPDERDNKLRCFAEMNELLRDGGALCVCPEGSLTPMCDHIREFKSGAFRFASQNDTPILPVTLRFSEYNSRGKKYKFPKFTIDVSEPIMPADASVMMEKAVEVMTKKCNKNFSSED